jgi:hypothetical protein
MPGQSLLRRLRASLHAPFAEHSPPGDTPETMRQAWEKVGRRTTRPPRAAAYRLRRGAQACGRASRLARDRLSRTPTGPPGSREGARREGRRWLWASDPCGGGSCYPPHAGHCQALALQRQSSWWLAAGQMAGRAGVSGSLSGAGAAVGGSTAAGSLSAISRSALFSVAGMLSETL